ncbi:hypothetical protein DSO57_1028856 [Entomophthora muscae]|uniref:Uncharacterized protein n=1 Tax=Entomophthora muscae TaxID=34485 RepID=A0ACC2UB34_9FUNG|nr:hypothetical protein DSO57_1028856 [Entomophthora muscae]
MLADKNKIHWFEDIGYRHADFSVCSSNALSDPTSPYRCQCPTQGSFYGDEGSCLPRFKNYSPSKLDQKNLVMEDK